MPDPLIDEWAEIPKPVIGMLHLLPLPGTPKFSGDLNGIESALLRDAESLANGGVHGLMIENFGDVPFSRDRVPAHIVSQLTKLAWSVRERFDLPLGINVLRNDGRSALAIAATVGARFIRVNVLCGVRVADEGIIEGIAHDLQRDRHTLGAQRVKILADVDVKHSAALSARSIEEEVADTVGRGLADAIIVSGDRTGEATDVATLESVKSASLVLVWVGSGVTAENIAGYAKHADGFIVGTAFKTDRQTTNPVDPNCVRALLRAL